MGKKRREKKRKRPKSSMYLYGKNSILERLRANPGSVKKILVEENFTDERVLDEIERANVPLKRVSERELMRTKHADRLQGIVAEVDLFKYTPIEALIERGKRDNRSCMWPRAARTSSRWPW
jgi:tRNA G18 (ribose-2'-O)-methylase SpoU